MLAWFSRRSAIVADTGNSNTMRIPWFHFNATDYCDYICLLCHSPLFSVQMAWRPTPSRRPASSLSMHSSARNTPQFVPNAQVDCLLRCSNRFFCVPQNCEVPLDHCSFIHSNCWQLVIGMDTSSRQTQRKGHESSQTFRSCTSPTHQIALVSCCAM